MLDNIEESLKELVAQNKIREAISVVEQEIRQNPIHDFFKAVGKSLLHLTNDLVNYLDHLFADATKKLEVKSLYAEMNGFTINYDLWYVNLFAFNRNEGLDDPDWLADYNYASENSLSINGLEDIQVVYKDYMDTSKWEDDAMESAAYECAVLIVLRVQELFKKAKEAAQARKLR